MPASSGVDTGYRIRGVGFRFQLAKDLNVNLSDLESELTFSDVYGWSVGVVPSDTAHRYVIRSMRTLFSTTRFGCHGVGHFFQTLGALNHFLILKVRFEWPSPAHVYFESLSIPVSN